MSDILKKVVEYQNRQIERFQPILKEIILNMTEEEKKIFAQLIYVPVEED